MSDKMSTVYLFTTPMKCADCGKVQPLVISRGQASFCIEDYERRKEKQRALRELNRMARGVK